MMVSRPRQPVLTGPFLHLSPPSGATSGAGVDGVSVAAAAEAVSVGSTVDAVSVGGAADGGTVDAVSDGGAADGDSIGVTDGDPAGAPGGRGGPLSTIRSPKTALNVLICGFAVRIWARVQFDRSPESGRHHKKSGRLGGGKAHVAWAGGSEKTRTKSKIRAVCTYSYHSSREPVYVLWTSGGLEGRNPWLDHRNE